MKAFVQAVVDQLMAVEPSRFPAAGIPSDARQEGLLLGDAIASGSKLLWFANWLHSYTLSSQLHFAVQLSTQTATCCHWLGVVPMVPSPASVAATSLSPCLALSAEPSPLTLPSPIQKATDRSDSPLVVACWGWPVKARKPGKAWWGQGRLSNLCGCEEDTGWRGWEKVVAKRWGWGITMSFLT